jgi:hypothetical protein
MKNTTTMNTGAASLSDEQILEHFEMPGLNLEATLDAHDIGLLLTGIRALLVTHAPQADAAPDLAEFGEFASTSANVAQTVSEKCARLAELYRDEHAMSGQEEEICNAIAEACRDYGSTNVAQGAEAVVLQHVAVAEDGGKLRWMSGRRPRDCELYAMHDGGRIPPKLYAAPPAQTALTDDARDAAFERYADALLAISRYAKYTPGTAVEMCRIAHKALYKNAAQSASGDTK